MLKIEKNYNLKNLNTLSLESVAKYFACLKSKEDLLEAISFAKENKLKIVILGGGSNVLLLAKIDALVLKNEIKGMKIEKETKTKATISAYSGETWSSFVSFAVENNLYGIENLFLIYGTVGAAPVQNIGAYGVELKDVFVSLRAINLKTGKEKEFSKEECRFGYRDSVFKKSLKGKYFIYQVFISLSKKKSFKLDYGSIKTDLEAKGIRNPELKDVVSTIAEIRNSKLPNPYVIPNAGSFFKNPEISATKFKALQKKYPDMPFYHLVSKYKIPAGWLIENVGLKGKEFGPVSMYERQALILVNKGGNAKQALALVAKVRSEVSKKFGLDLELEVNVI